MSLSLDLYDQWLTMEKDGKWRFTSPTHVVLAFAKAMIAQTATIFLIGFVCATPLAKKIGEKIMKTVKSGTATTKKLDGADWILKYESKLPDYYLTSAQAKANGWIPKLANLSIACPNKMIFGGEYYNDNGHLPSKEGRIWYEADINYRFGYRNNQRVVYSNDGLIFVTYDHYKTFFEIV